MIPTYSWHKIADNISSLFFSEEGIAIAEAADKKLCVVRGKEKWYACAAKCPHAGAALSEGYIDGAENIVCPLHCYKFSLATGRNISGEGYQLKTFPVEVRADGVYAGF